MAKKKTSEALDAPKVDGLFMLYQPGGLGLSPVGVFLSVEDAKAHKFYNEDSVVVHLKEASIV